MDEDGDEMAMHVHKHASKNVWWNKELKVFEKHERIVTFFTFFKLFIDKDDGVEQYKCETSRSCTKPSKFWPLVECRDRERSERNFSSKMSLHK